MAHLEWGFRSEAPLGPSGASLMGCWFPLSGPYPHLRMYSGWEFGAGWAFCLEAKTQPA